MPPTQSNPAAPRISTNDPGQARAQAGQVWIPGPGAAGGSYQTGYIPAPGKGGQASFVPSPPPPKPITPLFGYKSGVTLNDDVTQLINNLHNSVASATGGKSFFVTDGARSARDQAIAMYNNYGPGEPNYRNKAAANEIKSAYLDGKKAGQSKLEIVNNMEKVISSQMANENYVSKHQVGKGMDLRLGDRDVRAAIEIDPSVQSIEDEDDHWHVQFK